MLDFQNPAAFLLLIFIPLLYIARRFHLFSGIYFPITFHDWNGKAFEWTNYFTKTIAIIAELLCTTSYICVVLAFASPVIHNQEKVYTSRGADILFVIDTSPSMAAKDIANEMRLEAACQAVHTFANFNEGTSFALVAMATEAAVVVPPTEDKNIFLERLDSLKIGELGDESAIGTGLATAVYHLISSTAAKKCIVLITDGENNAGSIHPNTAARLAKENNIALYVLGLGTKGVVPLEYVDQKTGNVISGYLKSDFDENQLRKIALQADGNYFSVENTGELASAITSIGKEQVLSQSYHIKNLDKLYYKNLLFIAIILIIISWCMKRLYLQDLI